jgi:hypothetical protein
MTPEQMLMVMDKVLPLETPKREKPTLSYLLYLLQQSEQGLMEFDEDAQRALVEDLKDKVDSYKYIDSKFDAEIERLGNQIQDLIEAKRSMVRNKEKLRELMAWHMNEKGYDRLPGQEYQVTLVKKKDVVLKLPEANAQVFMLYGADFVKRTYAWDNTAIKKAIKAGDEKFQGFGEEVETSHVQFRVRKQLE